MHLTLTWLQYLQLLTVAVATPAVDNYPPNDNRTLLVHVNHSYVTSISNYIVCTNGSCDMHVM